MKKILLFVLPILFFIGCAYNSRNLIEVSGKGMSFSYGLIAVKNLDRLIILRETNAGDGEVKNNIPAINEYICYREESAKPTEAQPAPSEEAKSGIVEPVVEAQPTPTPVEVPVP